MSRDTLWDYCLRHDLLAPGRAVLVGVSGGPDSLCLLDRLHALADEHDFPLTVAHFDHGLRPESGDEAAFVRAEAEARGRPFFTDIADTAAFAAKNKLSVEAAARQLRYAFLARAARQAGASYVAVAHTLDDQAETVLMHFLRGSGLAGLRGMQARSVLLGMVPGEGVKAEERAPDASPLSLIRPLLATNRQEVEKYCAEHGLQPRRDPSNADLAYTRNRLRHEILPILERENPNIRATLARTAEVLAGEHEMAEHQVDALWRTVAPLIEQQPGTAVFMRETWVPLTEAERRALLRRGAMQVLGNIRDLDFGPLEAAAWFSTWAGPGRTCELARGLWLTVAEERVILYRHAPSELPLPLLLDAAGQLPDGWRLVAESGDQIMWLDPGSHWEAVVDAASLTLPLVVRARRPGERFQPLGMGGQSVKLAHYMNNVGLPASQRDHFPLVVCGDAIVWVPGCRLDERFRVTQDTQHKTWLHFVYDKPVEP